MMPDKSEATNSAPDETRDDEVIDDSVVSEQHGNASEQGSAGESQDAAATDAESVAPETVDANGAGPAQATPEDVQADSETVVDLEEDELTLLRRQLSEAEARADENWDRLLRLQAEMENQRKRAQNDVNKARKFALEGIVGDLLPVKDSLEMGLSASQAEDADPKALVEGVQLTLKQLSQAFEKNNIVEVNPIDEKFDPEFHQAMSMQAVEGKPSNTVTAVMQKGYTLNDRLVRPALVMVAK